MEIEIETMIFNLSMRWWFAILKVNEEYSYIIPWICVDEVVKNSPKFCKK